MTVHSGPQTPPWDPTGLPPRAWAERCRHHHGRCAYRDDDPGRCPRCHRPWRRVAEDVMPHGCGKTAGTEHWARPRAGRAVTA